MYMSQAADLLESHHIIRSALLFKVYVVLMSGHRQIIAGEYLFDQPQSALRVAYRTTSGIQGLPKIRITVYEGMTAKNIADLIKKNIAGFDRETFLTMAKPYEGYLFPDTYFLYENADPKDVVAMLRETFMEKIKPVLLEVQAFGKPVEDVITMASLVEREANSSADRRIIAGILWKRIQARMPLQLDAPFYYILNKESAELTRADLAMDSPFNLYKHVGLPPTPISNPGLSAIIDTINPTATDYWYYLSDSKGVMHYAATHDGHVANKAKYLK
jgi:UPF0755 protein